VGEEGGSTSWFPMVQLWNMVWRGHLQGIHEGASVIQSTMRVLRERRFLVLRLIKAVKGVFMPKVRVLMNPWVSVITAHLLHVRRMGRRSVAKYIIWVTISSHRLWRDIFAASCREGYNFHFHLITSAE